MEKEDIIWINFKLKHKNDLVLKPILSRVANLHFHSTVVTARKPSLGQDNIFTGVCLSVHRDGGGLPERDAPCHRPLWTETFLDRTPEKRPSPQTEPPHLR